VYQREIFPNAPLEFVAAEVRFPYSPKLGRHESFDALVDLLGDLFPIPEREEQRGFAVGPQGVRAADPQVNYRLLAKDRMSSVTVGHSRVNVEVTDYREYTAFRELIRRCLTALDTLGVVVGIERVGLRFIDEVRVPDAKAPSDWRGYIADEFLASLVLSEHGSVDGLEGLVRLTTGAATQLVVKYASLDGQGVVGGGPLRRRSSPDSGPFFVIDTDSFWQSPNLMDFEVDAVLELFDVLHDPVGAVFHQMITARLKDEVLRSEP